MIETILLFTLRPGVTDEQIEALRAALAAIPSEGRRNMRLGRDIGLVERERLRRGAVDPLLVIDDAHQRPFPGHLGQQAQGRQADQKPVRWRPGTEAERDPQRVALRRRQTLQAVQHGRAQLVQHRERQLHLRLDTHRARHPAAGRLPGQVLQERGLAHPGLAPHHETTAFTRTHRRQQPVEHVAFGVAVGQLRHCPRPGNSAGTCTALTLLPDQRTGHSD